jgi:hypothetical protein
MKSYARILAPLAVAAFLAPALSLFAQSKPASSNEIVTPKVEIFLGYSRFGTFSNKVVDGNRIVNMNGGSASVAYNFNRWIGLVADVGGYDDSQLVLTGTGANQPLTVNSSGKAYTYLFGPRLSFRNTTRFTPFAQILVGGIHASEVDASGCIGTPDCIALPAQEAFAAAAGGGLDFRLSRHFTLRPVQAEYLMTRFAVVGYGSPGTAATQNDLRLSSGIVLAFGGKPPVPVALSCTVQPATAYPGDPLTATAVATNLNPKHHAIYSWTTTGGTTTGTDATTPITTAGIAPGTYTLTGHVVEGKHPYEQATCTSTFTIQPFDPPTISCSANPSSVQPGDPVTITAQGVSPQNRPLTYSYSATAGTITGNTASATLSTASTPAGPITVTCSVVDDLGKTATGTTTVSVAAPPPPPAPLTRDLCAVAFDRDHHRPERVDNEAKACLDTIALDLQHEPNSRLVIVGNYGPDEKPVTGARRTMNVRQYLINEKGIDPARMDIRVGTNTGRTATDTFVPEGATWVDPGTTPVDPTLELPGEAHRKAHSKAHPKHHPEAK